MNTKCNRKANDSRAKWEPRQYSRALVLALFSLMLATLMTACGGGGDDPPASTATAGISKGVIEDKGSVMVNGVKFEIDVNTVIKIDDTPGHLETELNRGQVVSVKGTFDDKNGTATEIEVHDHLQGLVEAVDAVNKTITVMGRVIRFEDNITRVNDDNPKVFGVGNAAFVAGQRIEVSGFDDNGGAIRATRIDDRSLESEIEVKGVVSAMTASSFTLTAGATVFTVNFATTPAGVANGSVVEVRGSLAGTVITALPNVRGVSLEDDGLDDNAAKVEVEGIVTSGSSPSFVIDGITVTTTGSTKFENGLAADVIPNAKVEAEGPMVNGVLQAVKVSFRSNIRIQGLVTAVAGDILTVLGKTVYTTKTTDFRPSSGNPTSIASIVAGATYVEVRGNLDMNGNLVATRLDLENDTKEFIMSPVIAKDASAYTVTLLFGNTVVTTDAATQFRLDNDQATDRASFFNLVLPGTASAAGTVVKARLVAGTLVAEELEIEGER